MFKKGKANESLKKVYRKHLQQLAKSDFKLVSSDQAWFLVLDYMLIYDLPSGTLDDWLELSMPLWIKEHQGATVGEFLDYLDEQKQEYEEFQISLQELEG